MASFSFWLISSKLLSWGWFCGKIGVLVMFFVVSVFFWMNILELIFLSCDKFGNRIGPLEMFFVVSISFWINLFEL